MCKGVSKLDFIAPEELGRGVMYLEGLREWLLGKNEINGWENRGYQIME